MHGDVFRATLMKVRAHTPKKYLTPQKKIVNYLNKIRLPTDQKSGMMLTIR
jgi:hypothetical protein